MDGDSFDNLLRSFDETRSRRRVARALAGLALGGIFGAVMGDGAEARKNTRRNKDTGGGREKNNESCAPCVKRRRNGTCGEFLRDGATCNDTGKCYQGTCIARPTCVGAFGTCTGVNPCCSQSCAPIANQCFYSGIGQSCFDSKDCHPDQNLSCVGYRCR